MIHYSTARIDQLISEDIPYIDLTSTVLGIDQRPGEMRFFTREDCVLAGIEAATQLVKELGLTITQTTPAGTRLAAGDEFFVVQGPADALHQAWKVTLNLFEHLSAIATKTRSMVDAAHSANPYCEVLTTRKSMPGTKDLVTSALIAGGAFPHRLGLSETTLVFDHHITFMGGFDAFLEKLPEIRSRCVEKKFFVEAGVEEAKILAKAGVDGIQVDKVPPAELAVLVKELREIDPHLTLIAAGGVNPENAAAYAATGVDGLATTACYSAKPLDMSVRMIPLN